MGLALQCVEHRASIFLWRIEREFFPLLRVSPHDANNPVGNAGTAVPDPAVLRTYMSHVYYKADVCIERTAEWLQNMDERQVFKVLQRSGIECHAHYGPRASKLFRKLTTFDDAALPAYCCKEYQPLAGLRLSDLKDLSGNHEGEQRSFHNGKWDRVRVRI